MHTNTRYLPTSVYYIIGNEFCERFSYYGIKAILAIYLVSWLGYSQDNGTVTLHAFNFFAYFFSLAGIFSNYLAVV